MTRPHYISQDRTVTGADIDAAAHALELGTDLSLSWEEFCTVAELVLRTHARALSDAYARGLEDAADATTKLRYLPSQGIDHEMQMYNDGLEAAVSAIRALGSK